METLLFILIAGLLTAPIVAAWPRPAQRRRERYRRPLLDAGVHLRFADKGESLWCCLPRQRGEIVCRAFRSDEIWTLSGVVDDERRRRLLRCAASMPTSVDEIVLSAGEVAARWRERDEESDARAIIEALRACLQVVEG